MKNYQDYYNYSILYVIKFWKLDEVKSISKSNLKNILPENVINFDIFLQSLPITAGFLNFDEQIRDDYKILYLIERMNKSQGLIKLQKKNGTTL